MKRRWIWIALFLPLTAAVIGGWRARTPPAASADAAVGLLSEAAEAGYERALAPRPLVFPEDHGPHPGFRQEWWYYTGNLEARDGRRFGYQLTFFRFALAPPAAMPSRASAWAGEQVYLAHFAVTDVAGRRFFQWERRSRAALGLAGAEAAPFRVWLEDWSAAGTATATLPMRLRAATPEAAIELELDSAKPVVLQGEAGFSRKGAAPGNASYYYSYTRMPTTGRLRLGAERIEVSGASWMDREWSTSALEEGQAGWDWFSLQLAGGEELMFYQLRRRDGGIDAHSRGVWVDGAGAARPLRRDEVDIEVAARWRSPASGVLYPAAWRLRVPALDLDLEVRPQLADQEIRQGFRYWEGTVAVGGRRGDLPVQGTGYVELVGYATAAGGEDDRDR